MNFQFIPTTSCITVGSLNYMAVICQENGVATQCDFFWMHQHSPLAGIQLSCREAIRDTSRTK